MGYYEQIIVLSSNEILSKSENKWTIWIYMDESQKYFAEGE